MIFYINNKIKNRETQITILKVNKNFFVQSYTKNIFLYLYIIIIINDTIIIKNDRKCHKKRPDRKIFTKARRNKIQLWMNHNKNYQFLLIKI